MFRPLVLSAAAGGLVGGLLVAAFQLTVATPLIVEAEVFEAIDAAAHHLVPSESGPVVATSTHGQATAGFPRQMMTTFATVVYATGACLILLAMMVFAGRSIEPRSALNWGLAGFVAVALAPALGLPPELPGMPAADVVDRQIWWFATVAATAAGLWAVLSGRPAWIAGGLVLVVLPHLVGAPQPESHDSAVPAALAAHFVAASFVSSLIFWTAAPVSAGYAFRRLARAEAGNG